MLHGTALLWFASVGTLSLLACSDIDLGLDRGRDGPPAPTTGPQPESGTLAGITAAHNAERAVTGGGLPALTWDDDLAGVAQAWSNHLAEQGCGLVHSSSGYGENLYWTSGTATPEEVVEAWVSEKADYTYSRVGSDGECSAVCGHYTQVVWEDTRRVGCALAECPNGGEVWTCNYDPPGNYLSEFPY